MEGNIQTVLDTRGALRCVRFDSGNVGVVTTHGNTKLVVGPFQQLSFADNGFLRVFNGREFFIDMKNGELYAQMPEFVHFGDFEIANIGGYLCTRTKKLYEVKAIPAEAWHGKYGLYLSLPYSGEPEEKIKKMMIWTPSRYVESTENIRVFGGFLRARGVFLEKNDGDRGVFPVFGKTLFCVETV